MQEITKIVITGGPCAGKSTAMSRIQTEFSELGYTVLFVPETASEFITGGVAPWTCGTNRDYQICQMTLQMEKERLWLQAARTMPKDKILIVCDRGLMDNRAYMNDEEYAYVLDHFGTGEVELRDSYDAVFHLVSAAKGAEEFYSTANNAARTETVEEAARLDDRIISAWCGHPHLRVIDNATFFDDKMERLIAEISAFLGEPDPTETERKYLIEYPDTAYLDSLPNCRKVEITQTYLGSRSNEETRVRRRGVDGHYMYYKTEKISIDGLRRVERERRLSESEYNELLAYADPSREVINKTRYCLTYKTQYFEIDLYPFSREHAIMEIELSDENEAIEFPDMIKVIKEVTYDESYKNSMLAKRSEGF